MRKTITLLNAKTHDAKVTLTWYKGTPYFNAESADEFSTFTIFRREEPDFHFGEDYGEFFVNTSDDGDDAEMIFQGPLPANNDRKFSYTDAGVQIGRTYSYFVQTSTSGKTGPIPVRVRDPRIWWTADELDAQLDSVAEIAKDSNVTCKLWTCGQTAMGRNIPCIELGRGPRTLGLVGTIHASEAGPELIVAGIESLLRDCPELLDGCRIVAIPSVNIDEREKATRGTPWYLRTNSQGVDLNRNFPAAWDSTDYGYGLDSSDSDSGTYRGPSPASAPETQAVMRVFEQNRPDVVFSFHALASICGLPMLAARAGEKDEAYANACRDLGGSYAAGLYDEERLNTPWLHFGTSAGSLPAWLYQEFNIPAFDLEADPSGPEKPCITDQTDIDLLQTFQTMHAKAIQTSVRNLQEQTNPACPS